MIQAFCQFLDSTTTLTKLTISRCEHLWNYDVLLRIARNRTLSDVKLDLSRSPDYHVNLVNYNWYNDLRAAVESPFENIEKLDVSLTDDERNLLFPHLKSVTDLTVRLVDAISNDHLSSLCHLPGLRKIRIGSYYGGPVDGIIDGEVLAQLTRLCPRLIEISIGLRGKSLIGPTVSDSVIEEVARSLPNLEEFHLVAEETKITEHSILHFGQHCKALRSFSITGKPNFIELAKRGSPGIFPQLEEFNMRNWHIFYTPSQDFSMLCHEEFMMVAGRIARFMPKCRSFATNNAEEFNQSPAEDRFDLDGEVSALLPLFRGEREPTDEQTMAFTWFPSTLPTAA